LKEDEERMKDTKSEPNNKTREAEIEVKKYCFQEEESKGRQNDLPAEFHS